MKIHIHVGHLYFALEHTAFHEKDLNCELNNQQQVSIIKKKMQQKMLKVKQDRQLRHLNLARKYLNEPLTCDLFKKIKILIK